MTNDLNSNSRSGYRSKRKKTNIVLNSLIIVVLLLIIFVAYNIFANGNDNAAPKKDTTKTEQKENKDNHKESKTVTKKEDKSLNDTAAEGALSGDNATTSEDSATSGDTTTPEADQSQAVVTEGDGNSNVRKATENPAWQPVGTSQTGEHTPVYDQSSVDWQEMLNAISYATGLDKGNMTVYWLGRDKSTTNGSFGTVTSKDKQQKFNVYLQWVDGQGWKPTKVEELAQVEQ